MLRRIRWMMPVMLLAAPVAHAEEGHEPVATEPDASEETLALPDAAAPEAHENAEHGLRAANEARDARRAYGEARAERAGDNRRDAARRD
ncbi:MAG: hypothetical protein U5K33_04330 [Halofilum sp. (in: g-proteobacteria)]|nr:hypothetical protein [Halofilum sp. (in: g-proteobacteria)]